MPIQLACPMKSNYFKIIHTSQILVAQSIKYNNTVEKKQCSIPHII